MKLCKESELWLRNRLQGQAAILEGNRSENQQPRLEVFVSIALGGVNKKTQFSVPADIQDCSRQFEGRTRVLIRGKETEIMPGKVFIGADGTISARAGSQCLQMSETGAGTSRKQFMEECNFCIRQV